ncbi:hypothetical protein Ahy_A02g006951 [Arachis hypogaea]|uniref:Transposase MuDR plant domain-containing protein n=1 Tax=Arachis hypogaea TaxID=3818 RepID=A0A445EBE1_ARAHY|nr:hypothetical protein Ahy_A02g006951 [Arachis hypogaea]
MDDRVLLKVYYFGQILLQTCDCEKIDSRMSRKISCILYRYPVPVFGGFVQFQTKYIMDEASIQEMFSIDSEEEFESNYEVVSPDGNEDQGDGTVAPNVTGVANALANEVPFEEPSFMRVMDLEAMHASEFSDYMSGEVSIVADDEFAVGMKFSSRKVVIKAMKEHTLRRSVDYRVYESEPLTFYVKCTQYGSGCDWLIRMKQKTLREEEDEGMDVGWGRKEK